MPIHEYRCEKCGTEFEDVTIKINDAKQTLKCPNCSADVTRLVSSGSFIVHGYNANNGYAGHMR